MNAFWPFRMQSIIRPANINETQPSQLSHSKVTGNNRKITTLTQRKAGLAVIKDNRVLCSIRQQKKTGTVSGKKKRKKYPNT